MYKADRESIRLRCLELAVGRSQSHDAPADVVAAAEAFYLFLREDIIVLEAHAAQKRAEQMLRGSA